MSDQYCLEPKTEADCLGNIREFLNGCAATGVELFEARDLYTGDNFPQVLNTLAAINIATEGLGSGAQRKHAELEKAFWPSFCLFLSPNREMDLVKRRAE
ncbi:rho guanine nucleotide exchange factor 6-like [Varanus komodoensis]|uniref:rho guanine nucleotide exchange factor 6-like n=1 Tax=Varanus komodoensis TaxID=61221 RepID=UPI001CF78E55|nr:rho guanine nucleotide exchange factor 6-like [Varanus komodoensis]